MVHNIFVGFYYRNLGYVFAVKPATDAKNLTKPLKPWTEIMKNICIIIRYKMFLIYNQHVTFWNQSLSFSAT